MSRIVLLKAKIFIFISAAFAAAAVVFARKKNMAF
tara:strand:+ start:1009 stop:1113 length:105 start_codon:yes stop_codon:yes gene_type:complete